MISFACPSCGKSLKVQPDLAGRTGKCVHCGKPVTIPQPLAHAAQATPSLASSSPATPPPSTLQPLNPSPSSHQPLGPPMANSESLNPGWKSLLLAGVIGKGQFTVTRSLHVFSFAMCVGCIALGTLLALMMIWGNFTSAFLGKAWSSIGVLFVASVITLVVTTAFGGKERPGL